MISYSEVIHGDFQSIYVAYTPYIAPIIRSCSFDTYDQLKPTWVVVNSNYFFIWMCFFQRASEYYIIKGFILKTRVPFEPLRDKFFWATCLNHIILSWFLIFCTRRVLIIPDVYCILLRILVWYTCWWHSRQFWVM